MKAFDKDAKTAIKAGSPANFKKASNNLLKVVKFLFAQSKHFSPIYKAEAHKAVFDKDLDKLVQTLLHAEYALAKSQSAQKEVIKDYTSIVAELKKDGVAGLTAITAPDPKKASGALSKVKNGLATAGSKIKAGAKAAGSKIKAGAQAAGTKIKAGAKAAKAKLTHKDPANASADPQAPAAEEDQPAEDAGDQPTDDGSDAETPADDTSSDAGDEEQPADDGSEQPAEDDSEQPAEDDSEQ
jgi:hypothetical protein